MAGPDRQHCHDFAETYTGLLGQGLDRETDQATLQVYLQKFSDDELMALLLPRLNAEELDEFLDLIGRTLRRHLSGEEYHRLFLRRGPEGSRQA
ncbi:MAG: cytoplasmic protein [Candidatus Adiutrix sp.]|jgi:TorA maturation chaperone TorD|nr:cytoplasmic protein [Candidatus Adiutrix sp.]